MGPGDVGDLPKLRLAHRSRPVPPCCPLAALPLPTDAGVMVGGKGVKGV